MHISVQYYSVLNRTQNVIFNGYLKYDSLKYDYDLFVINL